MDDKFAWIGLGCTLFATVIGYISYRQGLNKALKQEVSSDATEHANVTTKLDYISRGIEDIRLDIKDQGRRMDNLTERITRVEESSKSAHKRLDDMVKEGA